MLPRYAFTFALLVLAACSTLPAPRTITQHLVYAQETATAANHLAASLVTAGSINVDQAKRIGQTTDVVAATVRTARRLLDVGDAAGAQGQLNALRAELLVLSEFLKAHGRSP